jgi:16S rRNA (guanine527-N7)-methyltransferase
VELEAIAELLEPFLVTSPTPDLLQHISTYIDILLRWNARLNLTSVRDPESIVTRHFGESLFAARHLFPGASQSSTAPGPRLIDIGSGAGFPGLVIKLWFPELQVTLIESNHKKTTFLREVSRALDLRNINVRLDRAENFPGPAADIVTLRAVERFDQVLPVAAGAVAPGGRIALLIGEQQARQAREFLAGFQWNEPFSVPLSDRRILLIGSKAEPNQ